MDIDVPILTGLHKPYRRARCRQAQWLRQCCSTTLTIATNERFEGVVDASEEAFGELNDERYAAVLESFIATVVKTAATTATQQEGGAS